MSKISKKDLPAYVRKCYDVARKANQKNREAEIERLKFYAGGDQQWRQDEIDKRKNQQRPWVTINKCKPAVDQIEGDIRLNPPGPQCHPVGAGADADTADIWEGYIREIEYRSDAKTAYATAGKYSAASGYGVLELATEYSGNRSFSQRIRIDTVEDPGCVFYDPTSRKANRQDASWAGKLKMYSRQDYIAAFGSDRKVLKNRNIQSALGWIQDAMGVDGSLSEINEWTGSGEGPYYVCEFYMVEVERKELRMYKKGDAEIAFYDDEAIPAGFRTMDDPEDPDRYMREDPIRTISKHLVDALEVLGETEWSGSIIPLIPVLGPEIYIEGKLHRLSLISGAIDSQRALNYTASTAVELAGAMPKSPWIGPKGSFDDPRWATANSEMWAFLEYTPVHTVDPTTGQTQLAPPPQRNQWETPIQWLLMLGAYFSDAIKAVTAIYDPSLGQVKGDQSGKAIEQLRSESNVGNFSYSDNLHRAIAVIYGEILVIGPKITDSNQAQTIIRADSQHEIVTINRVFGADGIDKATGKKGKPNSLQTGQYAVRVIVGKDFDTRQDEALAELGELLQANPQIAAVPGVAARMVRMIGKGNPEMEAIADLLSPPTDGDLSPQQMSQQLQQVQTQNQQLQQLVKQLNEALQAKLPQVQADIKKNALDNLTKLRVAEINASKDADNAKGDREAGLLEAILGMAHEAGMQAEEHAHAQQTQMNQQAHEAAGQASDQAHATQSQEADHEAAAEQAENDEQKESIEQ